MVRRLRSNVRLAKAAAFVLVAVLLVVFVFQVYWALGGLWGLSEALGQEISETSPPLQIASAIVALVLLAAVLAVLGRVGVWGAQLPSRLFQVGTWALTIALLLVALANFTAQTALERFGFAPLALVLAALSALVALSPTSDGRAHAAGDPKRELRREAVGRPG